MSRMENTEERLAFRIALEASGCAVETYEGNCMVVAIKRDCVPAVSQFANEHNAKLLDDMWYFPLGNDRVPDEFRHWCGRFTPENGFPRPGFWLYGKVELL